MNTNTNMNMNTTDIHLPERFVGETVELTRDCFLGQEGDRAVVTAINDDQMTLAFGDPSGDGSGTISIDADVDCKYVHAADL